MRAEFDHRIRKYKRDCTRYAKLYYRSVRAELRSAELRVYDRIDHYGIIFTKAHYRKGQQKRCKTFEDICIYYNSVSEKQRYQQQIAYRLVVYGEQCGRAGN